MPVHDVRSDVLAGRGVRPAAVAQGTGLPRSTIYKGIARGEIRHVRVGGAVSIPPDEAARLLGMEWPLPAAQPVKDAA